jgi:hypothetical protein
LDAAANTVVVPADSGSVMGMGADFVDEGAGADTAVWEEVHAAHSASTAHAPTRIDLVLIDVTDSFLGLLVCGH